MPQPIQRIRHFSPSAARGWSRISLLAAAIFIGATLEASTAELPAGFVRLSEIDPSIRQDMRYGGSENFMKRPLSGYSAQECILTRQAAQALAKVQTALKADGFGLVVFDCYRPQRAVTDMAQWAADGNEKDPQWYPSVKRNQLIAQGYIARRSGHSRGSTVDLGLTPLSSPAAADPACGAREAGTVELGTGFDCFDPASATTSGKLPEATRQNRDRLVKAMSKAGFKNYAREWWHFSLVGEPFPKKTFDFEVSAK